MTEFAAKVSFDTNDVLDSAFQSHRHRQCHSRPPADIRLTSQTACEGAHLLASEFTSTSLNTYDMTLPKNDMLAS